MSIIYHVDVNSAYLSWSATYMKYHLGELRDLRDIPSAVGGDQSKRHGIILAKSIPAKRFKIKTGETISEALAKCPELVLVPPDYKLYERCSKAFMDILREFSPVVEQYSIDEAYLEMTKLQKIYNDPVETANIIRNRIEQELGFTVNIGISHNKLLAKMASDFKKPNMVHTLFLNEIEEKMWHLPVSDLFFVGPATTKKLIKLGIKTIGELATSDPYMLKMHLKKHGELIWGFANGIDVSVVQSAPLPNKGYGNSTTIPFDVYEPGVAKMVLLSLAETVSARLRKDHVKAEIVAIGIKDFEFNYISHQCILDNPTNITREIHNAACALFDECWNGATIRHLGIHTSRIRNQEAVRQINIFDKTDYEKLERLDNTVDKIRARYGRDSIKRAVFVRSKVKHMSGGVPS